VRYPFDCPLDAPDETVTRRRLRTLDYSGYSARVPADGLGAIHVGGASPETRIRGNVRGVAGTLPGALVKEHGLRKHLRAPALRTKKMACYEITSMTTMSSPVRLASFIDRVQSSAFTRGGGARPLTFERSIRRDASIARETRWRARRTRDWPRDWPLASARASSRPVAIWKLSLRHLNLHLTSVRIVMHATIWRASLILRILYDRKRCGTIFHYAFVIIEKTKW